MGSVVPSVDGASMISGNGPSSAIRPAEKRLIPSRTALADGALVGLWICSRHILACYRICWLGLSAKTTLAAGAVKACSASLHPE
jgi:hypothetical protein